MPSGRKISIITILILKTHTPEKPETPFKGDIMGNKIIEFYFSLTNIFEKLEDFLLLGIRLTMAYGLYQPALKKLGNIEGTAQWFQSQLGLPFPTLNAYLAGGTEFLGFILLAIGLGARVISFPLIIVMLVAIFSLHWEHGFHAGNNGFEIPLYYLLFFALFIVRGAGKFSLDYFLIEKKRQS